MLSYPLFSDLFLPLMSLQHSLRWRELQLEAMNIQKEHLLVIRTLTQELDSDADNMNINRLRHDIIESI